MKAPIYMSLDMLFSTNEANLQAQLPGTTHDHLQIFNIEIKNKMKSHQMPEQVVFWKWVSPKTLGIVTQTSVYHWSLEGDSEPVKMFDRTGSLSNNHIINYRCDPSEKWLVLIGIAPGSAKRPQLVKGNMQLYFVDQQRSQALEAHATSFASYKVPGNENPSSLICFATKSFNAGNVTSKLHVIELGAQPGKPSFAKKQVDLFFPPDFADDFPVGMQISHKYGLVNVITKSGLLFVYDLETATAVYRNRISSDPIFLTCEASSVGGFYAVNRRGQVLLATVNESAIVPFVSGQLNNLELALSLAKRGNLPGAENLVVQRFQELFNQTKYKEAAELAAESPQGILRTPEIIAKFQCYLQKKAVEWIKIVTMLTNLGQRGGILRLVGKVSLLWGGIRDALSLIGKLITFLRLAERPLFQRMGRDMIYDSWSCDLLCAASSPELYRINLEQSGSDAEDDQSSDDEPANGKSKDAKKSRASRLYEVKDERHAEVFNNRKSLAREDALPFEERVKALKQ